MSINFDALLKGNILYKASVNHKKDSFSNSLDLLQVNSPKRKPHENQAFYANYFIATNEVFLFIIVHFAEQPNGQVQAQLEDASPICD